MRRRRASHVWQPAQQARALTFCLAPAIVVHLGAHSSSPDPDTDPDPDPDAGRGSWRRGCRTCSPLRRPVAWKPVPTVLVAPASPGPAVARSAGPPIPKGKAPNERCERRRSKPNLGCFHPVMRRRLRKGASQPPSLRDLSRQNGHPVGLRALMLERPHARRQAHLHTLAAASAATSPAGRSTPARKSWLSRPTAAPHQTIPHRVGKRHLLRCIAVRASSRQGAGNAH